MRYWSGVRRSRISAATGRNRRDDPTGVTEYLNRVAKYVVSSTMSDPQWENSTVLAGDPVEQTTALKSQPGKDIVLTGSISLAHALIAAGVVDEYRLFVYPTVQGRGRRLFPDGTAIPKVDAGGAAEVVPVGHHAAALRRMNAPIAPSRSQVLSELPRGGHRASRGPESGIGIATRRKRNGWTVIGPACCRSCGVHKPASSCSPAFS